MITPTAKSITLPRRANFLNSPSACCLSFPSPYERPLSFLYEPRSLLLGGTAGTPLSAAGAASPAASLGFTRFAQPPLDLHALVAQLELRPSGVFPPAAAADEVGVERPVAELPVTHPLEISSAVLAVELQLAALDEGGVDGR